MRVAVLAGGRSSEHEVSLHSAASVRAGVAAAGHDVLAVSVERSCVWVAVV
jgi:D-alanine-D-alanine ligase